MVPMYHLSWPLVIYFDMRERTYMVPMYHLSSPLGSILEGFGIDSKGL